MAKIIIDLDECLHLSQGCRMCIDECPMQLLEISWFSQAGRFVRDDGDCIECRNCEVTCPQKAVEVQSD